MVDKTECLFCRIARKEFNAAIVYEDKAVIAFLDIRPATKKGGHTLVMPKQHFELITDMPMAIINNVMSAVQKISKALLKDAEGVNLLQNNKRAAGQAIPHVHFHVIPRYQNDGVNVEKWEINEYKPGEIEKATARIKNLLKD